MATAERLDIEEGEDLLTFEKLKGRDITCPEWDHVSQTAMQG